MVAGLLMRKSRRPSDIRGDVVLITGGSSGLGLALASEFGRQHCRVAICARSAGHLHSAQLLLKKQGIDALAIPCDVSDPTQVEAMIRQVEDHFGPVDILVNNAGEILVAPVENTTPADFERAMNVMFWGVLHPTLTVLPAMRARRKGRIATITSVGGKVSVPHLLPYSCAKFAAVAFCEGLRSEMSRYGIKVTTIAPGLMRTGSHVNARFKGDHEREAAWFSAAASSPLMAMNAERAAAQVVSAVRRGSAERILSTQANLLARLHGAFPGLVPDLLALVNQCLPAATGDSTTEKRGVDLARKQGRFLDLLTTLGRRAGARLNQAAT
jgi:NAD(P)-dependent dehydrogenase (short-subunit alcohol dehydrogenase family)